MSTYRWQDWLHSRMAAQQGHVSFLYRNLITGECDGYEPDRIHPSASIIKMFLMSCIFEMEKQGRLSMTDRVRVEGRERDACSSGVLHFMQDIADISIRDMVELMIIISDNTATNMLLQITGMDGAQRYVRECLRLQGTRWERKMMDMEAIAAGRQNYTSAADCAWLLEEIYRGRLVSADASERMMQILKEQQFNDLIPDALAGLIPEGQVAHKTGGLDGVVHDAGIIDYGRQPFILCFFGSDTDVAEYSRLIREASRRIYCSINP